LTKVGSGTLTLSGTNTYTGATTISSGTLRAGAASGGQAFGNGSAVALADVAGATLDLNNFDQTIGSLAGGGTTGGNVTLGSATLTTGGNNTSTAFSGVISGTGALAKTGSGTFTLSGDNSHSGGTSSSGTGMLALAHSNAAGTGTISLASTQTGFNTTFQLSGGINVANDIVMDSATGRNTITSSSGNNNLSGDITINNNSTNLIVFQNRAGNGTTFTLGGATPNSTTLAAADYANTISFRANTGDTTALGVINSQILAPNATFNINNDGVWTVNSTGNSWAATTLSTSSSRIILGADDALATGARIDTGIVGASVDLNGFNQTVAGLDGTNTGAQIFNDSATTDSILTLAGLAADRSFAGAITDGSGGRITSLVMNNSNAFVQTLSGTNTFTGTTTVTAGTLLVNGSLASGSAVTVETNGILGGNGTINGTLAIDGKVAPGGVGIDIKTLNAGATTWNDGGVLNFDLATTGTTSDKLNITGDFIKGSAGTYEFNFMGSTPAWGTTFTLVEWSGDLTGFDIDASDFSYTNLGAGSYSTSYFSIDGKKLQFTAIPEPTSAMAGLLLGFGLLRRRRA
jgi:autotransporter-associated beta strand protein